MDIDNSLQIEVYSSGTTRINDEADELARAQALRFSTYYPGGLYGDASLFVAREILRYWAARGAQRLVLRNGQDIVWEGEIDQLGSRVEEAAEGSLLTCTGYWGARLMRRRLRRWYVDARVSEDIWRRMEVKGKEEIADVRRTDENGNPCLIIQPRRVAWALDQYYDAIYTPPAGEKVRRVEFDWIVASENDEDWTLRLYDLENATTLRSISVSATGGTVETGVQITLGTTSNKIAFRLESDAAQTPAPDADGNTSHGYVVNLKVYAETGNTGNYADTMDDIAKDLVTEFSAIFNSDKTHIGAPATPFAIPQYVSDYETLADILVQTTGYGDGASPPNLWAAYLIDSEQAATPDGKPVLVLAQQPALTDYDWGVYMHGENLVAPLEITRDYSKIANWMIVEYRLPAGRLEYKTPDDDAGLKDQTSIDTYGQRDSEPLTFGDADATAAVQLGKRALAHRKDPQYVLNGPIQVRGWILDEQEQRAPVCRVRAGQRIRILDYIDDLSGTGLTLLITATDYDAETETVSITTGTIDDWAALLAQNEFLTAGPREGKRVGAGLGWTRRRKKKKKRR